MISFSFTDEESVGKKRFPIPFEYDDISITVGGIGKFILSKSGKSVVILVRFEGGPFRFRMDGGLPVDGLSGYLVSDGDQYFFSREEALRFSCVIDTTSGGVSGFLRTTYYG